LTVDGDIVFVVVECCCWKDIPPSKMLKRHTKSVAQLSKLNIMTQQTTKYYDTTNN